MPWSPAPGPVSDLQVLSRGAQWLEISWRPHLEMYGEHDRYVVRVNGSERQCAACSEHQPPQGVVCCRLTDLTPDQQYLVQVTTPALTVTSVNLFLDTLSAGVCYE